MPEKGIFSSDFALPTGALDLFNKDDSNIDPANQTFQDITNNNGGSTSTGTTGTLVAGVIDDDATILFDSNIASATRLDTGVYNVDTDVTYATSGGEIRCAVQVTPRGLLTSPAAVVEEDYLGLTTVSPTAYQGGVVYDTVRGRLWATDFDHDTGFTTADIDRIGIYRRDDDSWDYIYMPAQFPAIFVQEGPPLIIDVTNRVAYVQVTGASDGTYPGVRCTLIYDLDTYQLLHNTWTDTTHGETGYFFVVGKDIANDRLMFRDDAGLTIWNASSGIPTTEIDPIAGETADNKEMICDASGQFWKTTGGSNPYDWKRVYLSGGLLTTTTVDTGTEGPDPTNMDWCYDSFTDTIYFMNFDGDRLYKLVCATDTITQVNTGDYASEAGAGHETSPKNLNFLVMASDGSRLLGIRTAGVFCFYIIDQSDGTIDFHYELDGPYSTNYNTNTIAVDTGAVFTLGSNRIQAIFFTGGSNGVGSVVYKPVIVAARMLDANTARVEIFDANNVAVRRNNAFNISFHGVEV